MRLAAFLFLMVAAWAQAQVSQPKFRPNGEFRILQFTDIHWSDDPAYTDKTTATLRAVMAKEKPDLIVLTGDNVNCIPMKNGLEHLGKIIEEANTPWTLIFGNHDEEQDMSKEEMYDYLKKFPHFFGEKGSVHGVGNFSIPVYKSSAGEPAAALYFIDSGDYTRNPKLGSYDWIKKDQIQWYAQTGDQYRQKHGKVLPSLMFFHIPLQEYNQTAKDPSVTGHVGEDVSSSEVNSGMFAALLEQKDVMGVFCGHDHNNNYIGIHQGIALGYGSKTGTDGYGELEQGGRMIILKEGKFAFNSYISTPKQTQYKFSYPAGVSEITPETQVLKALKVNPKNAGLNFKYFEGNAESVKDIAKMKFIKKGIAQSIGLKDATAEDHFALAFDGYIKIPSTGFYKFYTYSDDGSVLKIDGKTVVENDGGHSATRKEGTIALEKGFHKIEILYFEDYMGQVLEAGMAGLEMAEQVLPANLLFH